MNGCGSFRHNCAEHQSTPQPMTPDPALSISGAAGMPATGTTSRASLVNVWQRAIPEVDRTREWEVTWHCLFGGAWRVRFSTTGALHHFLRVSTAPALRFLPTQLTPFRDAGPNDSLRASAHDNALTLLGRDRFDRDHFARSPTTATSSRKDDERVSPARKCAIRFF
jgi:hypothetical protein